MRQSAPARYAVKRTRQKSGKTYGHWFRPAPVIRPQRLFSFGPCTACFLFSAQRKRGAPAGAQRSGSGGERRKERSLSGIFGFSRKWSGGVSSDDMGVHCPAITMAESPPPARASKSRPTRRAVTLHCHTLSKYAKYASTRTESCTISQLNKYTHRAYNAPIIQQHKGGPHHEE